MNEEGQEINGEVSAGAVESNGANGTGGAVADASAKDIQSMYDDLGIKAKAPASKSSKRPKADDGGDKKTAKQDDASGESGQEQKEDDDSKDKSKATPAANSDGVDGNATDEKGKKNSSKDGKDGKKDGEVQESGESDEAGVQKDESSDNEKTGETGEDADSEGDEGTGRDAEEGKRPGKSNPEIEKRFQKLTSEVKERDEVIAELQQKLQQSSIQQAQAKIAQEDPEYTIEDFLKVRDEDGNILDLDPERAELAWRRWKDGFDGRAAEREARANFEASQQEKAEAQTRQLMKDSADAYDTLAGLMDEYPELVSTSGQFDEEFAREAMPIIEEAVQYLDGTQPGNPEGKSPVIVGLKINPKTILKALKNIDSKKRNLPLNGVNDNVESRSNVSVPHGRSSDPNVNAANQLYKELGINKRV